MLPIKKLLTKYNYTAMTNKKNEYIVVHYVGAVSTAANNAVYYGSRNLGASAHYFVDEKEIWQIVEDKDRSWHCGGGLQGSGGHAFFQKCTNFNSIGIEMCVKKTAAGQWYFEEETVKNTIELVRYLMDKHGIPIERVIRHYDVTGKLCPAPYVDEKAWAEFKKRITNEEEKPMTNEEKTKFNALVEAVSDLAAKVDKLANPMIYNYIDGNMPEWARDSIAKIVQKGYLAGDENGLHLDDNLLRMLVILDRAGVFDR